MAAPAQFSVWLVNAGGGWTTSGTVNTADGTASYSRQVAADVPVGTGYHVYVYYRATSRRPLEPRRDRPRHGQRDRAAVFSAHHRHRARQHHQRRPGRQPRGHLGAQRARGRAGPVQRLAGQRRRRLDPRSGTVQRRRHAPATRASVRRRRARRHRLPASTSTTAPRSGDPWSIYGIAAGTVNVTAAPQHHQRRPAAAGVTSVGRRHQSLAVALDDQRRRPRRGQFSSLGA